MATKNVTIPASHKGLKAVYITPAEERLLLRASHPKGSPQPKKGPGGLLMMQEGGGGEDEFRLYEARMAAKRAKAKAKPKAKAKAKSKARAAVEARSKAAAAWGRAAHGISSSESAGDAGYGGHAEGEFGGTTW